MTDLGTSLRKTPQRMSLANIASADELEMQFNPSELSEKLSVAYNRLGVLGHSHKPLQYQQTENHTFNFDAAFRVYDDKGNRLAEIGYARRFLLSLCYPRRGGGSVVGGAPPRVLFVWPNLASLTSVITSLEITHTLFGSDGKPYHFGCKVGLEEIRDFRLYSEDVLDQGTQRSGSAAA